MTDKPSRLTIGDRVRWEGQVLEVVALDGPSPVLAPPAGGKPRTVAIERLTAAGDFAVIDAAPRATLAGSGELDALPAEVVADAQWWEKHIKDVLDVPEGRLRQREMAKVDELNAAGHAVALRLFQRRRQAYESQGLLGLVDQRLLRRSTAKGRTDERVVEALLAVLADNQDRSTATMSVIQRALRARLDLDHGAGVVPMPSKATLHRLVNRLREGKYALGSARARRTRGQQPKRLYGNVQALRPGELVEIDSTPLDVAVILSDGVVGRVELTALVDTATRTIAGAVLRPTTKAVDAAHLLARAMTPELMRPGWPEAISMAYSALPFQAMRNIDERLANAAARPVITPETVVYDHGKVFIGETFRRACHTLGISLQPAHPDTPTDKPHVERTLQSVGTLFVQHVRGYLGSSIERRGENAEEQATFSLVELQDLLDEWIVTGWQNRPHEGLRDPLMPDKPLTPNEMYAALLNVAGYVPVPLSGDEFIELLPGVRRAINRYGIKLNHRIYDSHVLDPYREQKSGITALKDLWDVRYDPYDVTRIWVRNHYAGGGWLTVPWRHLGSAPTPFGEDTWRHAQQILVDRGHHSPSEEQINDLVGSILDRTNPATTPGKSRTKRTRRIAARNAAMNQVRNDEPTLPSASEPPASTTPAARPSPPDVSDDVEPIVAEDDHEIQEADVIPLRPYNAAEEASRWW